MFTTSRSVVRLDSSSAFAKTALTMQNIELIIADWICQAKWKHKEIHDQ